MRSVQVITTHEGKFLSLEGMKCRLGDPDVTMQALAMLKVGRDRGDDAHVIMQHVIAGFLLDCAGIIERTKLDALRDELGGSGSVMSLNSFFVPCVIRVDGTVESVKPANGTDFQAEEMQKIVGGHFEMIPMTEARYMVMDENGKTDHKPANPKATALALGASHIARDDVIVGDVLVCFQNQVK